MSAHVTRDGWPSVAGMQMDHDTRGSDIAEVTLADALAWGENNRMRPTGHDAKDLASVNRMRALLKLPPFSLLPERAVADEPLPPPHEYEPGYAPPKRPFSMASNNPPVRHPQAPKETPTVANVSAVIVEPASKPIERNMRGLVDALFDELDEIRAGRGSEARVKQITQVSVRITELMGIEMKYRKMALEADGNEQKRLKQIAGMKEIEA